MNMALVDCFLSPIGEPHKVELFARVRYIGPNMKSEATFSHFLYDYGTTAEHDLEENKNKMKALWTLQDRWLILQKQIDNGTI